VPPPPCDIHGKECQVGGGRRAPLPHCEPAETSLAKIDPELFAIVEKVAAATADERLRRSRLSCRQLDAEFAAKWPGCRTWPEVEESEIGALIAEATAKATASRPAPPPPAIPAAPRERIVAAPPAPPVPSPSAEVTDLAAPRQRRRRRRPGIRVISFSDDSYPDPFRE
jgi:hypothetical protein